MNKFEVK